METDDYCCLNMPTITDYVETDEILENYQIPADRAKVEPKFKDQVDKNAGNDKYILLQCGMYMCAGEPNDQIN